MKENIWQRDIPYEIFKNLFAFTEKTFFALSPGEDNSYSFTLILLQRVVTGGDSKHSWLLLFPVFVLG